ncbi:MAG TPA: MBL fold metallo-hydrolase [Steroidobacteraceae bacterium]|nr:MBL fold metallo-hydrolase [Steroidobacteraceae bacterium]
MKLTFCGAAGQVTGSCFRFETGACHFLVDCGLFQGGRDAWARNVAPFLFDPKSVDFVILTHAHIDHSGLLPRLYAEGFRGPIYATPATRDLVAVMLPDSAWVMNGEAENAARRGRPYVVPYRMEDARAVLAQVRSVDYASAFEPGRGVRARLQDAGHILGSAFVELWLTGRGGTTRVVVSGDLGQPGRPIVRDPMPPMEADVLLLESTYGDRNHQPMSVTLERLAHSLRLALQERRGVVLVPAFAVGRTQEFLYHLNQLSRARRIRGPRVYVDSPMATEVTQITARHFEVFDEETRRIAGEPAGGDGSMRVSYTASVEESMALNGISGGAVIVAASGMCDGGRIRHHLKHHLPDPRTTVLFIGYQVAGTLGRRLVDGAATVRMFGEEIPVRAQVVMLEGFSAHADQSALLDWIRRLPRPPGELFLVHGEPEASAALRDRIAAEPGWRCRIPAHGDSVALTE